MKTLFLSTALMFVCCCNALFSNNTYPASSDVVKQYFTLLDQGKIEEIGALLSDDMMASAPFSPQMMNKQAWKGVGIGFVTAFPDMRHQIVDMFEAGNKVAVRGVFTGKNDGSFMGNPPTGNRVNQSFNTYFELDNTWKIKAIHVQFDQKALETQLMAGLPNPAVKAELDVRAFIDAVDMGDPDKALGYCSANSVTYFGGMETRGDDLKRRILAFKTGFPDIHRGVDACYVSGNTVIVRGWVTGTNTGTFAGKPATNNKVKAAWIGIYELDAAGKIDKAWVEFDRAAVEQQRSMVAGGR